jgi:hypothetical protein
MSGCAAEYCLDIEIIRWVSCRVFRAYIQRNEIVPFVFNLRPVRNREAHPPEYLQQLI